MHDHDMLEVRNGDGPMREAHIKKALAEHLFRTGAVETNVFLEELRLHGGEIRADLVQVDQMHCYEIKSAADSLTRLINQGSRYARFFDRVTLVMAERHVARAMELLPPWWGAMMIDSDTGDFVTLRVAGINVRQNSNSLASVLTKDEALRILEDLGQARGFRSKSLYVLQEHIAAALPLDEIKLRIRDALLVRVTHVQVIH